MKNNSWDSCLRLGAVGFVAVLTTVTFTAGLAAADDDDSEPPISLQALGISDSFGKWQGNTVNWVYNSTGAPSGWTDDNYTLAQMQLALDEWEGVCGITFVGRGVDDSATNGGAADGEVVFVWDASIGGAAGQAGPSWFESGSILTTHGLYPYTDGSLKMNPTSFARAGNATAADIEQNELQFSNTMIHEVGHLIGFGHSDDPVSRMYANPYNSLSHIRQDDEDGCVAMYGKPAAYVAPEKYSAPVAGSDPFNSLWLAAQADPTTAITSLDDQTDDNLAARFSYTTSGAEMLQVTSVVVDPHGFKNIVNERTFDLNSAATWTAWYTMTSFDRLRELPGVWTVYTIIGGETVSTLTIDVTPALPDYNAPPTAVVSFHDNPTTRVVTASVDVTGDGDSNTQNTSVIWHIPTVGAPSEAFVGSTGSDSESVDYNDLADHEMFVEIIDDGPRYSEDLPNNVGPAGDGFQTLFRYVSKDKTVAGDHDNNKTADVVLRNMSTGANFMYKMSGTTITQGVGIDTVSDTDWKIVGLADYTGDKKSDILWRHQGNGTIWLYEMDGETVLSSAAVGQVANLNWKIVGDGDYNGDGKADILWRDTVNGTIWLYEMDTRTVTRSVGIGTQPNLDWQIVASGDYDGDGCTDILWRNVVSGTNWMYLMNGATIMTSAGVSVAPDTNWEVVATGDYNGDSRADILWRHALSGTNWVYLMNGTAIQTSASVSVLPDTNWIVVGDGDYNGDGKADVLWRNTSTGSNFMYLMDGLTISSNAQVSVVADQNWEIIHIP